MREFYGKIIEKIPIFKKYFDKNFLKEICKIMKE